MAAHASSVTPNRERDASDNRSPRRSWLRQLWVASSLIQRQLGKHVGAKVTRWVLVFWVVGYALVLVLTNSTTAEVAALWLRTAFVQGVWLVLPALLSAVRSQTSDEIAHLWHWYGVRSGLLELASWLGAARWLAVQFGVASVALASFALLFVASADSTHQLGQVVFRTVIYAGVLALGLAGLVRLARWLWPARPLWALLGLLLGPLVFGDWLSVPSAFSATGHLSVWTTSPAIVGHRI